MEPPIPIQHKWYEPLSLSWSILIRVFYRANESIASGKEDSFVLAARILFDNSLRSKDANYAYGKFVSESIVYIKHQKVFLTSLRSAI